MENSRYRQSAARAKAVLDMMTLLKEEFPSQNFETALYRLLVEVIDPLIREFAPDFFERSAADDPPEGT
jgi:hypothetical protein